VYVKIIRLAKQNVIAINGKIFFMKRHIRDARSAKNH
jgi:hypothetical protein